MQLAPVLGTQPTATPQPPTAGLMRMVYGDWLEQLGAIGGGDPVSRTDLELRFESNRDAVLAQAALGDAIDGVRLLVKRQDGSAPHAEPVSAGEIARFVARIRDLIDVDARGAAFFVTAPVPDVNAKLDWLLRDEIAGLPVRWRTADAPGAAPQV
jgi:hypothetical protein